MGFYDHPAFQGVDKNFLLSLERKFSSLQGKNSNEILAALIAIANESKRYNVNLSKEQQKVLIQYLRANLPANKRAQFDSIVNVIMQQQQ